MPQVKASVPQDCPPPQIPPPLQTPISSSGCYLWLWPTGYKSGFYAPPSSSLINFLELLTAFRKTFCLPNHQFTIKGYNTETAQWKRGIGQGMGKGCRVFLLSLSTSLPAPPQVHQPGHSEPQSFWDFIEASLHRHDRLNHWSLMIELNLQLSSPSPLPWYWGAGMGLLQPSNNMGCSLATCPHL